MKDYPLLIGEKEITTENHLNVLDPFNNEIVGKTYLAGHVELENAIELAQSVQAKHLNNRQIVPVIHIRNPWGAHDIENRSCYYKLLRLSTFRPL